MNKSNGFNTTNTSIGKMLQMKNNMNIKGNSNLNTDNNTQYQ